MENAERVQKINKHTLSPEKSAQTAGGGQTLDNRFLPELELASNLDVLYLGKEKFFNERLSTLEEPRSSLTPKRSKNSGVPFAMDGMGGLLWRFTLGGLIFILVHALPVLAIAVGLFGAFNLAKISIERPEAVVNALITENPVLDVIGPLITAAIIIITLFFIFRSLLIKAYT